jgi:hypothetical protein
VADMVMSMPEPRVRRQAEPEQEEEEEETIQAKLLAGETTPLVQRQALSQQWKARVQAAKRNHLECRDQHQYHHQ